MSAPYKVLTYLFFATREQGRAVRIATYVLLSYHALSVYNVETAFQIIAVGYTLALQIINSTTLPSVFTEPTPVLTSKQHY